MPRDFSRTERVGQLIQTGIAKHIQEFLRDKVQTLVTVTAVEVSKDFSVARVFISTFPDDAVSLNEVLHQLEPQTKEFRHVLAHELALRRMPKLRFVFDDSIKTGSHLSSLLQKIEV